jgi:hypothetical protein
MATPWEKRRGRTTKSLLGKQKSKIADFAFLQDFRQTWKHHRKLDPEQLGFADKVTSVKSIGFYHRADELCELVGVPGIWREVCLRAI